MHACGHQICQQLVVRVPFCVLDVSCATANRRSHFNQLTYHSVRFISHSYASLPGETTSVFNHFKSPCWSEKLKASFRVMNLVNNKNALQNFREEYYTEKFLCVVRSTRSAKHVKRSACFFSSWDFSVTHGGMYDIEQRVNSKRHINKGKAIGSTLKISH